MICFQLATCKIDGGQCVYTTTEVGPIRHHRPGTGTLSHKSMEEAFAAGLEPGFGGGGGGAVTSSSLVTDVNGIWNGKGGYVRPRVRLTPPACEWSRCVEQL